MKVFTLVCVFSLCLTTRAQATLSAFCAERVQEVTLTGSDDAGEGRIWNVLRVPAGKRWNYEGSDHVIPLNDKYKGNFEVSLGQFACSTHFNFYYTLAGDHAVTRAYVEQLATQLETAWTTLSGDQGFRSPLDLQADGRYVHFDDFQRIPVLIFNTFDRANHANGTPIIHIVPGLAHSNRSPHHELFHVIKHGYTLFNRPWLNEGMARWSEKFVSGAAAPCTGDGGLGSYQPLTFNLRERDYCYTARFWEYLGLKYGAAEAGRVDGSDVVRAVLDEMGIVANGDEAAAMRAIERALDRFGAQRTRASGYGNAYKEWARGNYVDDTVPPGVVRSRAPARPRWKEAGEFGTGGERYLWHDFTFNTPSRGPITIAIRAAAGNFGSHKDADDLRFRLDGTLLGNWSSANAFDGTELDGKVRTIHLVQRDVPLGLHTLRLEADQQPILFSVTVYSGEIPLVHQSSALSPLCLTQLPDGRLMPTVCYASDGTLLSTTFDLPAGFSDASILLEGRASSAKQNASLGFPAADDDLRILIDGVPLGSYNSEEGLDGDYLEGDLAAVELRAVALGSGQHTLEIRANGKTYVDHVAVFPTPPFLPLFSLDGGSLSPWSTNYHVIPITAELLPSRDEVLAPRNLTINIGTYTWSDEFGPPFYSLLLIDADGNLLRSLTGADSHSVTRSITPDTLSQLGAGGRIVLVVGSRDASGTYFVKTKR